jgi:hypothetical protein
LKKGIEGISSPFEKGGSRGIYFEKSLLTSSFDSAQDMLFRKREIERVRDANRLKPGSYFSPDLKAAAR